MNDEITLYDLINLVDNTRPNSFDPRVKTGWLNEIEFKVVKDILNRAKGTKTEFDPYDYDKDHDKALVIPKTFADVYITYIYCKIDFTQGETQRYQNDQIMFNAAYNDFAAYYRRSHYPRAIV